MSLIPTRPCPKCQRRLIGRMDTDGRGNLVEEWPRCICEAGAKPVQLQPDELTYAEREQVARNTGICMDCSERVEGQKGKALRCGPHKVRARLDQGNASKKRPAGAARRRAYEQAYRQGEVRARRNARRRELHQERMANDPNYAAAFRRRRERETSIKSPSYAKRIAYFNRTNADPKRAQKKRDWALRKYYELHPERPSPVCATCSESIDWKSGVDKGRPPKYHQTRECNPYFRAVGQERAA
jgi:hypothetical protein